MDRHPFVQLKEVVNDVCMVRAGRTTKHNLVLMDWWCRQVFSVPHSHLLPPLHITYPRGTGSFNSCDALLKRVEENDPTMVELIILSMKTFGATEVDRLATALASGVNTHLETISASGHKIPPESLQRLGAALATGKSNVKNLAIGDSTMGDDGVCALCEGLVSSSKSEASEQQQQLQSLDLSYKGM